MTRIDQAPPAAPTNGGDASSGGDIAARRVGVEPRPQLAGLGLGPPRPRPPPVLLQPGGDAADHDADAHQREDQHEQRHLSANAGGAELNGSNETVMISRFATANITMRMAERN